MRTTQRETSDLVRRRMAVLTAPQGQARRAADHERPFDDVLEEPDAWPGTGSPGAYRARPPELPEPPEPPEAAVPGPAATAGLTAPAAPAAPARRGPAPPSRLRLAFRERFDMDRRALAGLGVLLLLGSGYAVQRFWLGRPEPVAVPAAGASASSLGGAASGASAALSMDGAAPSASASPVVDVAGKVRRPGLVRLPPGARVQDALLAAGGELPGTDVMGLNLARRVVDGEEIVVGGPPPAAGPGGPAPGTPASPLSLNAATAAQLEALPGVGPTLAQRIIRFREEHGGFTSVDQLLKVSGFGARRLRDLRDGLRP